MEQYLTFCTQNLCSSNASDTQASGVTRPGAVGLGNASTHFIQLFKNALLNRNLDKSMPKNAYFFSPQTPALLFPLTDVALSSALALYVVYYFENVQM